MYTETRMEDILSLSNSLSIPSGVLLNDRVRIFKEDAPAAQFEAGQQK